MTVVIDAPILCILELNNNIFKCKFQADWGDQMQLDEVVKKHATSPSEYFEYYQNARTHSMGYYL